MDYEKANLVEKAREYLRCHPEGGNAMEFARWVGYESVFHAKHGLNILRQQREATRWEGIYFLNSEEGLRNLKRRKVTVHKYRSMENAARYVSSCVNGTTVEKYRRMTGKPKEEVAEMFEQLVRERKLVRAGEIFRSTHAPENRASEVQHEIHMDIDQDDSSLPEYHSGPGSGENSELSAVARERQDYLAGIATTLREDLIRRNNGIALMLWAKLRKISYDDALDALKILGERGEVSRRSGRIMYRPGLDRLDR